MRNAEDTARRVAERLSRIDGVAAVALGGSRARGAAHENSDVDLGLYYRRERRPELSALREAAAELDERGALAGTEVTEYGAWGPWVDGGAWLRIDGFAVDWIYREVERVSEVIDACMRGEVGCDYYLGHPHGFHHHIYAGEVACGRPLCDAEGALADLRRRTSPYPAALRDALVRHWLFDADFMHRLAVKPAARGDVFHVAGCLFRVAAALVQVLFAANETWFLNEKGALEATRSFDRCPAGFAGAFADLLAAPGRDAPGLDVSIARAGDLLSQIRDLVG